MFQFNRKKLICGLAVICVFVVFLISTVSGALAHDFWVNAVGQEDGIFRADIGYGHDFPKAETIAADRAHIFAPLRLVMPDGAVILDQVGENFAYQKKIELQKGSYAVIGDYRPTFWSNGPQGWAQKDRTQRPDATYVEEAIMCAKTIFNVQGAADAGAITKPIGQRIEIVPMTHPDMAKAEEKLLVKVWCDGQPARAVQVEATFDGFPDKKNKAFKGETDAEGVVAIFPLTPGYWLVKAKHAYDHPDKERADEVVLVATLTFQVQESGK